jgi:hypothetical protein
MVRHLFYQKSTLRRENLVGQILRLANDNGGQNYTLLKAISRIIKYKIFWTQIFYFKNFEGIGKSHCGQKRFSGLPID